ncbi:MAG: hypothetical protein E3J67_00275 [Dehalococcoidia bacterium]|nr:MAG: hypothetical protein E3J67_00275 [Dehalococcoidia bacterium]
MDWSLIPIIICILLFAFSVVAATWNLFKGLRVMQETSIPFFWKSVKKMRHRILALRERPDYEIALEDEIQNMLRRTDEQLKAIRKAYPGMLELTLEDIDLSQGIQTQATIRIALAAAYYAMATIWLTLANMLASV